MGSVYVALTNSTQPFTFKAQSYASYAIVGRFYVSNSNGIEIWLGPEVTLPAHTSGVWTTGTINTTLSAGTYTLGFYGWSEDETLGSTTITVNSGGGGSGGGGQIIVPSASCTISWAEISDYPGDRWYSNSSIHNLTGAWDHIYQAYPMASGCTDISGSWDYLVPYYGWTSARCFACYRESSRTDTTVTYNYSVWYTGYNYANFPLFYCNVEEDNQAGTALKSVVSLNGVNETSAGGGGVGWNLATNLGVFNRSVTFDRGADDKERRIYFFLGNNGGQVAVSGGTAVMTKFVFNKGEGLKIPVPKLDKVTVTAAVDSSTHGTAKVNNATSVTVNRNTTVTLTATPNTNWGFTGWYNGNTFLGADNPYSYVATENITITAYFQDTSPKASYIEEKVTNKAYRLRDGGAVHGSGTAGRITKWTAADTAGTAAVITGATSAPSSLSNGNITAVNSESGYPNYTSWQAGNQVNISPELAYAAIKVIFKSETATTYTVELHTSAYGGGYTGGFNDGNYDWSISISTNGGTSFTQIAGATNTWCHFGGSGGWLRSDSPGIYDNTAYIINKTTSAQSIVFRVSNYFHGYGTSTKDISFTVPPIGFGPAIGYSSSVKKSRCSVKYSGSWKDAIMWVKVNGTWIKGHYY